MPFLSPSKEIFVYMYTFCILFKFFLDKMIKLQYAASVSTYLGELSFFLLLFENIKFDILYSG